MRTRMGMGIEMRREEEERGKGREEKGREGKETREKRKAGVKEHEGPLHEHSGRKLP